jgi:hypothetical protein
MGTIMMERMKNSKHKEDAMIQTELESTTGKAYITISLPILIP